jgi:large subunit ribosomal protein L25
MAQTVTVKAERRSSAGTGAARKLRQAGLVPAVVYGSGRNTESISLNLADLEKVLQGTSGSTVIELSVDGVPLRALIREIQRHPTRKTIWHVDFLEIHAGEKITLNVPLALVGTPEGVRNAGGVLEQFLREIEVEVLPRHIPENFEVDVSALEIGHSLHVSDISVENAEILAEASQTICTVVPPRVEEVAVPEVVEEEEVARPRPRGRKRRRPHPRARRPRSNHCAPSSRWAIPVRSMQSPGTTPASCWRMCWRSSGASPSSGAGGTPWPPRESTGGSRSCSSSRRPT